MKKNILAFFLFLYSITIFAQTKYFNTFTVINNGKGIDINDNVQLKIEKNYLSLYSKNFKFNNTVKTEINELYNDTEKGDIVATQYLT